MKNIHIQRGDDGIAHASPSNSTIGVGEAACIEIRDVGTFKVVGVPWQFIAVDNNPCDNCPIADLGVYKVCICAKGTVLHDISKIME